MTTAPSGNSTPTATTPVPLMPDASSVLTNSKRRRSSIVTTIATTGVGRNSGVASTGSTAVHRRLPDSSPGGRNSTTPMGQRSDRACRDREIVCVFTPPSLLPRARRVSRARQPYVSELRERGEGVSRRKRRSFRSGGRLDRLVFRLYVVSKYLVAQFSLGEVVFRGRVPITHRTVTFHPTSYSNLVVARY